MSKDIKLFKNFSENYFSNGKVKIFYRMGGKGYPLLLLHGYPQNHYMWYLTAPELMKRFTIIIPDLRGYGQSSAPKRASSHNKYSKKMMAKDLIKLMDYLNFKNFFVVGHDRGGRVAHRLARDNRDRIDRLMVIDICPTLDMYELTDVKFAQAYFHWFFLTQPIGVPEKMIGSDPKFWVKLCLNSWSDNHDFSDVEKKYIQAFLSPDKIHATCEDYRASATIDLEHDIQDRHNKLSLPIHVIWGKKSYIGKSFNPIEIWQKYTSSVVTGKAIKCGHFIPEESPKETINEIISFFKR